MCGGNERGTGATHRDSFGPTVHISRLLPTLGLGELQLEGGEV